MSTADEYERQMLELINEERAEAGVDPLQLERDLNTSSEDHSQWMLDEDVFSHTGQGGSSAGDRIQEADFELSGSWSWGENIAWQSERGAEGISDDVEDLHEALMDSPDHRENILNPDFDYIGLGIETGEFDGYDAVMVTQNFGSTDADVDLDTATDPVSEDASPVLVADTPPAADPASPPLVETPPEQEDPPADQPMTFADLLELLGFTVTTTETDFVFEPIEPDDLVADVDVQPNSSSDLDRDLPDTVDVPFEDFFFQDFFDFAA
ncbi:CAP domain-containing protein [Litoreibacter roseus]|uniref:SCP domain-containing protein n=1 Tax=Litoreibacter roseus TaxID=2601869 RepID=A0A6N6JBS0_9RHOB|nr:CAP domain-containing protein [Litoreibacter roseus]GFE63731.1 hypothetical protein KIN_08050 [Litoreibacter roseus]